MSSVFETVLSAARTVGERVGGFSFLFLLVPLAAFAALLTASFCSARARRLPKAWFLRLSDLCLCLFFACSAAGRPESAVLLAAVALAGKALSIALYWLLHAPRPRRKKRAPLPAEDEAEEGSPPVPQPVPPMPQPPKVRCFSEEEGVRIDKDVRLGPVLAALERLRSLPLGAGDRLETQKTEELLRVYRAKGDLSAAEADTLNDIFASLLKMLAKYGA